MRAVILAGGKGTRLRPYTASIPKPLLPIGDLPILEVVLRQLARHGFDHITLLLNHMSHLFIAILGDGERFGLKIDFVIEDAPLGTAGSIALIDALPDNFLVMNGDLLTTLDYKALFNAHVGAANFGTIAVSQRTHTVDYGVIESDETGQLIRYNEKPELDYQVSMGVNILSNQCLEYIAHGEYLDMPTLMQSMRDDGKPVATYATGCYWQDIGRIDDYDQATRDFEADPSRFIPASQ